MAETRIQWKRVAAEVAAIVFGILIAFWIDAEWQRRQETRAEQEVLASLEADLQSSLDGLRSRWLPMHFGALQATGDVLGQALDLPAGTMDFSRLRRRWDGRLPRGGRLDVNVLLGNVYDGEVSAKIHVGEFRGGSMESDRSLLEGSAASEGGARP